MVDSLINEMITAVLQTADPTQAVAQHLAKRPLSAKRIFVVSVGKAAVAMAKAAIDSLSDTIEAGVIISKAPPKLTDPRFQLYQGSHPVPDQRSVQATQAVEKLLQQTTSADDVLCLISGGASALFTDPMLPLSQWQALNKALLHCGCSINEVNTVRQYFDRVKGGGLLNWVGPARCTTLILSDVIGNEMAHIGSGPTVPTMKSATAVQAIFTQYKVADYLDTETHAAVNALLKSANTLGSSPSSLVENHIIGDIQKAAEAATAVAQANNFTTELVTTELVGEAKEVGQAIAQSALEMPPGHCRVYGGETTVTILGDAPGVGGRNQELALAAAIALDGHPDVWVATLATDGEDGPNAGAGAIVNGRTLQQARAFNLDAADYLHRHDSYTFFDKLGKGHLKIGSTGTNVNDLTIVIRDWGSGIGD